MKITGRYSMVNIRSILREIDRRCLRRDILFMGDIKDTKLYSLLGIDTLSSHWGDSRFWVARLDFYRDEMMECYREMDDFTNDKWAEHYILNLSRRYRHDRRFIFRFLTQVMFDGIGGHCSSAQIAASADAYNSFHNILKARVRQLARLLFPYIWF